MATISDFRRLALLLPGAEESAHMGSADFRVEGRIFATLAHQEQGYGNLKLTPEQQAAFVEEYPGLFIPIAGGWGRAGMTHIRLAAATEDVLAGALRTAWKLRLEKGKPGKSKRPAKATTARAARKNPDHLARRLFFACSRCAALSRSGTLLLLALLVCRPVRLAFCVIFRETPLSRHSGWLAFCGSSLLRARSCLEPAQNPASILMFLNLLSSP